MRLSRCLWPSIFLVLLSSCYRHGGENISPYYESRWRASDLGGHTSVNTMLLGYPNADRDGKPVILCENLSGFRLFDAPAGRRIVFIGTRKGDPYPAFRVYVSEDARPARDVTESVVRLGKKGGQIPPTAKCNEDFYFKDAEYVDSRLVINFSVLDTAAGFGAARNVPITWEALAQP